MIKKQTFRLSSTSCVARLLALAVVTLTIASAEVSQACPFCSAQGQTLSEELASADAAVLAELIKPTSQPKIDESDIGAIGVPDPDSDEAKFKIVQVLKGKKLIEGVEEIETTFYGEGNSNEVYLITGLGSEKPEWGTPVPLSDPGRKYLAKLPDLTTNEIDRLEFFQGYLENSDPMLAQDAYDEFARASYETVIGLKDRMDRDQLIAWIQDIKVPPSRRRLYLTMLGVCGSAEDVKILEEMIRSDDEKVKTALDALVAAYLTLQGEEGLTLVEELFLKKKDARYIDTYATVMALRFHARQGDVIPRERLVAAMRYLLDHPDLADQIIPDLARWKDWTVMDRLVEMFKSDDKKFKWVRVPVVNYLMAASREDGETGEQAKVALEELTELDPKTVNRAKSFFAFGSYASGREPTPGGAKDEVATESKDAESKDPENKNAENKNAENKVPENKNPESKTAGGEGAGDAATAAETPKFDPPILEDTQEEKPTALVSTKREGAKTNSEPVADDESDAKPGSDEKSAPPTTSQADDAASTDSIEDKPNATEETTSKSSETLAKNTVASPTGGRTSGDSPGESAAEPSKVMILGTTIAVGLVILAALWWILTGAGKGRVH